MITIRIGGVAPDLETRLRELREDYEACVARAHEDEAKRRRHAQDLLGVIIWDGDELWYDRVLQATIRDFSGGSWMPDAAPYGLIGGSFWMPRDCIGDRKVHARWRAESALRKRLGLPAAPFPVEPTYGPETP